MNEAPGGRVGPSLPLPSAPRAGRARGRDGSGKVRLGLFGGALGLGLLGALVLSGLWPGAAHAATAGPNGTGLGAAVSGALSPGTLSKLLTSPSLALILIVAGVVVLPGVLLLMSSFTRIVVVLSLVRTAVGTPQTPPNQLIVALSLILTLFTMAPTLKAVNQTAVTPYMAGRIGVRAALSRAQTPVKEFMAAGTREQDLVTLLDATHEPKPASLSALPLLTLIPAFAVSQLTLAFQMAFLLFLPFMLIDFLVSSVLMSLGMMMLPPTVVSLPFKLLLFVLVNGWGLVVGTLVAVPHG